MHILPTLSLASRWVKKGLERNKIVSYLSLFFCHSSLHLLLSYKCKMFIFYLLCIFLNSHIHWEDSVFMEHGKHFVLMKWQRMVDTHIVPISTAYTHIPFPIRLWKWITRAWVRTTEPLEKDSGKLSVMNHQYRWNWKDREAFWHIKRSHFL